VRAGRPVLADIGFDLEPGGALVLNGPNGAGKSTLLMCLAGLIAHEGHVEWTGADQDGPARSIHFAGHLNAVRPDLTLFENLGFWADMLGGDRARIDPALDQAGLHGLSGYDARHLSAGQGHRLALARLLVAPRPVWLLDEPSSALDAAGDEWVARLIADHIAQGGMAIVATHRPLELETETLQTLTLAGSEVSA